MAIRQTFETDPYAAELKANVLNVFERDGRVCAVLDDTIMYPEGGGQPCDLGRIGRTNVLGVAHGQEGIIHILDGPLEKGPTLVQLDWERRYDHMQQHTGQHLLTAVAQDHFGWATTAFHLGQDLCNVELDASQISRQQRLDLEDAVVKEIISARSIKVSWIKLEEYGTMNVRSRGLPDGHEGDVRLVEIVGLDVNTCGGTHLASTSELECLKLIGSESARGGTRLFFVFGKRLRRRVEAHEQRNQELRAMLGRPDDGLVEAVRGRLAHEKELERSLRHTDEELASAYAKSLAMEQGPLLIHHFENKDAAFLQKIVRLLLEAGASQIIFVTASKDGNAFFCLAKEPGSKADIPKLGREIAAVLNGKGGGAGAQFQGKFEDVVKLEEARSLLHTVVKCS